MQATNNGLVASTSRVVGGGIPVADYYSTIVVASSKQTKKQICIRSTS